ncbi:Hypothetical protein NocV09_04700220 [Nannochloropsis oceanica]
MSRRLLKHGAEAFKPHFVDGRWQRPLISKRVAARLRKEALANGTYGSLQDTASTAGSVSSSSSRDGGREGGRVGGWDPAWDRVEAPRVLRPAKLHKRERTREERFQKIETAMAGMDAKVAQHKESLKSLKPKVGIESLYKKIVTEAQKRR